MHEQDRFIERMGRLFEETEALPRIAGRIVGLLLLTPGECSIDEMAEHLAVSRASISIDARRLVQGGVVERVTRPGDRRDYYRIAPDHYARALERRLAVIERLAEVIAEGRQMKIKSAVVRERLAEAAAVLALVISTTKQELESWRATREQRSAASRRGKNGRVGT